MSAYELGPRDLRAIAAIRRRLSAKYFVDAPPAAVLVDSNLKRTERLAEGFRSFAPNAHVLLVKRADDFSAEELSLGTFVWFCVNCDDTKKKLRVALQQDPCATLVVSAEDEIALSALYRLGIANLGPPSTLVPVLGDMWRAHLATRPGRIRAAYEEACCRAICDELSPTIAERAGYVPSALAVERFDVVEMRAVQRALLAFRGNKAAAGL